jgi:hypothetical protein
MVHAALAAVGDFAVLVPCPRYPGSEMARKVMETLPRLLQGKKIDDFIDIGAAAAPGAPASRSSADLRVGGQSIRRAV